MSEEVVPWTEWVYGVLGEQQKVISRLPKSPIRTGTNISGLAGGSTLCGTVGGGVEAGPEVLKD